MPSRKEKTAALAAAGTAAAAAAGVGIKRLHRAGDGDGTPFESDSYRLLSGEPVAEGIKRLLMARVDGAVGNLRGEAGVDAAEGVHEARKDVKKIRSALRLVRDAIGEGDWRRENEHYRDCARQLSEFRDAEILVETLDALEDGFGPATREQIGRLRGELEQENRAAQDEGSLERAMATAAAELEQGRPRIESLPLKGDGWEEIGPGLHRAYRRGRKRLRDVEEDASVANLHELRKRVKDLWYQLRLLRDADPELLELLAGHAHDLSDHLGDDHDLALLRERAQLRSTAFDPAALRHLLERIDQRRGELQFAAISLGRRIYDEKPKKFSKRLERRWEAWRERIPVAA